jgi:hypothetical protein
MKKVGSLFVFLFLTLVVFGQSKNEVSIVYGIGKYDLGLPGLAGGAGYEGKGSTILGLKYSRSITRLLAIESGIEYSYHKIQITSAPGLPPNPHAATIQMFTIPVYGSILFWKYFFVNAGPLLDFEVNRLKTPETDSQTGLGFGFGVGGKYTKNNFTISLNPYFETHAIIPFNKERNHLRGGEMGVKIGLGFLF